MKAALKEAGLLNVLVIVSQGDFTSTPFILQESQIVQGLAVERSYTSIAGCFSDARFPITVTRRMV